MLKKFLLVGSVLAVSVNVACANPAPYIGAGLGITTNTTTSGSHFGSYRGVPFNVFAGYGGNVNESFYLAGEVGGTVGNATLNDNGTLKTSYSYGASVIPGVMLSDHTLAFGRVGVVGTHFSSLDTTRAGAQFGLGMQTSLTQNLDLRGEYDYTAYKNVNALRFNDSSNPRTDAFNLGLVYKFE